MDSIVCSLLIIFVNLKNHLNNVLTYVHTLRRTLCSVHVVYTSYKNTSQIYCY